MKVLDPGLERPLSWSAVAKVTTYNGASYEIRGQIARVMHTKNKKSLLVVGNGTMVVGINVVEKKKRRKK